MKKFLWLSLILIMPSLLVSHDFFLFPSTFHAAPGQKVKITIHVDDLFPGQSTKWNSQRVLRFERVTGSVRRDLRKETPERDSSGVIVSLENGGVHVFALDWAARLIELQPDQFAHYVSSEGLDHILTLRKERGEEQKPGRERYSRYVKTLVSAGEGNSHALDQVLGQTIELVPLDNPYAGNVGDSISVQLFFRGKPLSNALVSSTYAGATDKPDTYAQSGRTNGQGIVTVKLLHAGPWLIRTVHMLPLSNSKEADWESWWASLTFEVK